MNEIYQCVKPRALKQCFFVLLIAGAGMFYTGKAALTFGFFAGQVIGLSYVLILGRRILTSVDCDPSAAVRSMQFGWVFRLFLILGSLFVVIQISEALFWSVVAGFFLTECIVIGNAIAVVLERKS